MSTIVEMCVDSVKAAIAAEEGGAHRVELCANLLEGGTTPSHGCIITTRQNLGIKMNVIIRPRGGDFLYSDAEYDVMRQDIIHARECGADGVVIGLLSVDGSVDKLRTAELVSLARPMNVTFHRAFDMARNPFQALEDIIELGIDRILTSGQEPTALEGLELLEKLVKQAGERIIIMPGGGINARNIHRILACGAREIHMHSARIIPSRMEYQPNRCHMGGALRPAEYSYSLTSSQDVADIIAATHH